VNGCNPLACDAFSTVEDKDICHAVLACVRRSSCIKNSSVDCYCGIGVDIVSCREDTENAQGDCKDLLSAALPAGASAATIVNELNDPKLPSGAAMILASCDHDFCGSPLNGGNNECSPYCM
jgi:hypothetical protein